MSVRVELGLAGVVIGVAGAAVFVAGAATVLAVGAIASMVQKNGSKMLLTEKDIKEDNIKPPKISKTAKSFSQNIDKQTTYQTKFVDKDIILQALKKANYTYTKSGRHIICNIPNNKIAIQKTSGGNYELQISGDCNSDKIQKFYNKVGKEYENIVQQKICNNIKSKVANISNMKLEQEEVLEDNSVLLTISL